MTTFQIPFQFLDRYPNAPAARPVDTSIAAAEVAEPTVAEYRQRILDKLRLVPSTPDEMAILIERRPSYVRPRFSELKKMGLIEPTGERRLNDTGLMAKVWRAK